MRHALVAVFDSAIMTMLSDVLEIEGYHVTQAYNQDQLIAVLRSALHPLVVLLDMWAIEGGPSFSDEFLATFVAEHHRWERHAYVVIGCGPHFVPPPSHDRILPLGTYRGDTAHAVYGRSTTRDCRNRCCPPLASGAQGGRRPATLRPTASAAS
jgi:hypothetical protein